MENQYFCKVNQMCEKFAEHAKAKVLFLKTLTQCRLLKNSEKENPLRLLLEQQFAEVIHN